MMWPFTFAQTTVGAALVAAAIALIQGAKSPNGVRLEKLISKLLAGSAVPTGLFLMACAFNTSWAQRLSDLGIYLLAAGLALLFVSVKEILTPN